MRKRGLLAVFNIGNESTRVCVINKRIRKRKPAAENGLHARCKRRVSSDSRMADILQQLDSVGSAKCYL